MTFFSIFAYQHVSAPLPIIYIVKNTYSGKQLPWGSYKLSMEQYRGEVAAATGSEHHRIWEVAG